MKYSYLCFKTLVICQYRCCSMQYLLLRATSVACTYGYYSKCKMSILFLDQCRFHVLSNGTPASAVSVIFCAEKKTIHGNWARLQRVLSVRT